MVNSILFNIRKFTSNIRLIDDEKSIKSLIRQWDGSDLYEDNQLTEAKEEIDLMHQINVQFKKEINNLMAKVELLTKILLHENKQLEELIEKCPNCSTIDLSRQKLTDEDMGIVVKLGIMKKQCKILWLVENNITSVGISILADALKTNTTLEELYLQYNYISDDGVHSLIEPLSNNNTLKILALGHNGITDAAANDISEIIKTNKGLTELYLSENQITDEAVEIWANEIQLIDTNLQVLNLGESSLLTDACVDFLLPMIKNMTSLREFIIFDCNLSQPAKEKLKTINQLKTDVKIYM